VRNPSGFVCGRFPFAEVRLSTCQTCASFALFTRVPRFWSRSPYGRCRSPRVEERHPLFDAPAFTARTPTLTSLSPCYCRGCYCQRRELPSSSCARLHHRERLPLHAAYITSLPALFLPLSYTNNNSSNNNNNNNNNIVCIFLAPCFLTLPPCVSDRSPLR